MKLIIILFPIMLQAPSPVWLYRSWTELVTAKNPGPNTKANVQDFCFLENDPHNFIDASFNWKNSAEGPSFWFEIHDIFVNYYCNMEAK